MEELKKELEKATAELAREYTELKNKVYSPDFQQEGEEAEAIGKRLHELESNYDWFNVEFTDPETGKKGLKDVTGKILVPALYDGFKEFHNYIFTPNAPVIAIEGGKYGIVAGNGSGKVFCEFKYDHMASLEPFTTLFLARWDGEKDCFGVVAFYGAIICPNILTSYCEPFSRIVIIKSDDKYGVIDSETNQCVLPEYDDVEIDVDADVIFHKDGQKGYVTDKGEFISINQYETDEKYIDVNLVTTWSQD